MSAVNYLPNSFTSEVFSRRSQPGGINERLAKALADMKHGAYANAEYKTHFFRAFNNSWSDNYGYRDGQSREFSANIFGEILGSSFGTFLGAQGNHYPGNNSEKPNLLTDNAKAKTVVVVGEPSGANKALKTLYANQFVTYNDARNGDIDEEEKQGKSYLVKEFVKSTNDGVDDDLNAIVLTGPLLYTVHTGDQTTPVASPAKGKRSMKKRTIADVDGQDDPDTDSSAATQAQSPDVLFPSRNEMVPGALYDPRTQRDYGGPMYAQRLAKLIQPDYRDIDGDIVPPWEFYDKLRPGTLVLANCTFSVYVMPANSKQTLALPRKIYHANIRSLRVVAISDVPVVEPIAIAATVLPSPGDGDDAGSRAFEALGFLNAAGSSGIRNSGGASSSSKSVVSNPSKTRYGTASSSKSGGSDPLPVSRSSTLSVDGLDFDVDVHMEEEVTLPDKKKKKSK